MTSGIDTLGPIRWRLIPLGLVALLIVTVVSLRGDDSPPSRAHWSLPLVVTYSVNQKGTGPEEHEIRIWSWKEWSDETVTGDATGYRVVADPQRGVSGGYPEWDELQHLADADAAETLAPNGWMRPMPAFAPGASSKAAESAAEEARQRLGIPAEVHLRAQVTHEVKSVVLAEPNIPLVHVDRRTGESMEVVSIVPNRGGPNRP